MVCCEQQQRLVLAHTCISTSLPAAGCPADAFIGMLGLGVIAPGDMALLTGSSHLQLGLAASPLSGQGMFGSYPSALLPGLHVVEGGQTSTGSILAWLRGRVLGAEEGQQQGEGEGSSQAAPGGGAPPTPSAGGRDLSYAALNAAAAALPIGCEGLTCLDHFQVRAWGGGGGSGDGGQG